MAVGEVIGCGLPDGTTIGLSATEKVSFYGVTPVVQAGAITAATDLTTALVSITALIAAVKNIGITA